MASIEIKKQGLDRKWLGRCEKCQGNVFLDELHTRRKFGQISFFSHKKCPANVKQ